MDYDNYTVGGGVKASLDLDKISINAEFNISYTDAEIFSKNATHIRVRFLSPPGALGEEILSLRVSVTFLKRSSRELKIA